MHIRITWGDFENILGTIPDRMKSQCLRAVALRTGTVVLFFDQCHSEHCSLWGLSDESNNRPTPLPHPFPFYFSSFGSSFLKLIRCHHMRGLSELCIFSTSVKCHRKMQQDTGSEIVFEDFKGDPFDLQSCYCNTREGHADCEQRQRRFLKDRGTFGELG